MKKLILTLSVILFAMSSANAGVPIFSTNSQDSQEMSIKPNEQQNIFTQNVHSTGSPIESYDTPAVNTKPYGSIQNEGYKSAIGNLESAQAEIRENLIDVKAQYADAKGRYDVAKAQCNVLKKQIKTSESKIKKLEKTKKNIAKNMIEGI